jgi:murein DD-endopeptidase MepM/ murein hydrolase activator NlpD
MNGRENKVRFITILVIPDGAKTTRQYLIPKIAIRFLSIIALAVLVLFSYLLYDYHQLRDIRKSYQTVTLENEGLKGEARLLVNNLNEVKKSLQQIQNYSTKLSEITQLQVNTVSEKTGIGPLTPVEYDIAQKRAQNQQPANNYIPLGINIEKLVFKPVFKQLNTLNTETNQNALELQKLLSTLSQQKSLLSSIPSTAPVSGWFASGFGFRVSPFTMQKTWHMGVDIAAPMGTPISAPADGIVLYVGERSGFGKFIVISHGYGIVSRYGHNAHNMVLAGQRVKRGDQIAAVGMTGRTTGPHLHYEILVNGRNVDPKKFMLDLVD